MQSTSENSGKFDKNAFEKAFKEHFTGLCFFAQKYISDLDASKSIVHDAFINLWEKKETIDMNKSVKSYLFTSVHNRCLNYIRDNKKFDHSEFTLEMIQSNTNWEDADTLVQSEIENKINTSIDSLPEKCKEIFKMNRFEGLKYAEIAEKLNISIKTVETQMSKALKILRGDLKEYLSILLLLWMGMK